MTTAKLDCGTEFKLSYVQQMRALYANQKMMSNHEKALDLVANLYNMRGRLGTLTKLLNGEYQIQKS